MGDLRSIIVMALTALALVLSPLPASAQSTGPVVAYALNEVSGTTASDGSGNGNNGVLTNGALFSVGRNANGVRLDGVNARESRQSCLPANHRQHDVERMGELKRIPL